VARLSRSEVLQRRLGALGQLQLYRSSTDRRHRSIGGYATPAPALDGCSCAACTAARAGEDLYIGFDTADAAVTIEQIAGEHEAAIAA
jgi:hypothetical protein